MQLTLDFEKKLEDFRLQRRGGKGLKCYKITEKTGDIIGVKADTDDHEIMMITTAGIIIQIRMNEIRNYGRITSGVKLMNLDEGVTIVKVAKVREMTEAERIAMEEKAKAEAAAGIVDGQYVEDADDAEEKDAPEQAGLDEEPAEGSEEDKE